MNGTELLQQGKSLTLAFRSLGNTLKPTDERNAWFYHLIIDLMNCALKAYGRLFQSYTHNDYHFLAGACRSLLELAIITEYVFLSESTARDFCEDRLIDGRELLEALKALELHHDEQADTTELDRALAAFQQQMTVENVKQRKHLEISDMAKQVKLEQEYKSLNRVCSKLVHACAWSVMAVNDEVNSFPESRELLLLHGIGSMARKKIAIQGAKHGIKIPHPDM
jgi:hypothetical protein